MKLVNLLIHLKADRKKVVTLPLATIIKVYGKVAALFQLSNRQTMRFQLSNRRTTRMTCTKIPAPVQPLLPELPKLLPFEAHKNVKVGQFFL